MALSINFEHTEEGISYNSNVYGDVAFAKYSIDGYWTLELTNDPIGYAVHPQFHSLKAVEYTVLAYVHELEATGH